MIPSSKITACSCKFSIASDKLQVALPAAPSGKLPATWLAKLLKIVVHGCSQVLADSTAAPYLWNVEHRGSQDCMASVSLTSPSGACAAADPDLTPAIAAAQINALISIHKAGYQGDTSKQSVLDVNTSPSTYVPCHGEHRMLHTNSVMRHAAYI